jgi:hypothetical protein
MTDLRVSPATLEDAVEMAVTLNAAQTELILSLGDKSVQECVKRSLNGSTHAWAGRVDGELVAMWGVYPLADGVGYPWMYSTERLHGVPKLTVSLARRVVDEMLTLYPRLFGVVDTRFEESVRFAKAVGFKVGEYVVEPPFVTIERTAVWPV